MPVLQPESLEDAGFQADLAALAPDVIAVVAFRILPRAAYETARLGAFNLHGSLLPAYRGAAPIARALMDGVAETGVTTFLLRPTVDTGDVLLVRRTPVGPDETMGDVHDRLAALGAEAVGRDGPRPGRGHARAGRAGRRPRQRGPQAVPRRRPDRLEPAGAARPRPRPRPLARAGRVDDVARRRRRGRDVQAVPDARRGRAGAARRARCSTPARGSSSRAASGAVEVLEGQRRARSACPRPTCCAGPPRPSARRLG